MNRDERAMLAVFDVFDTLVVGGSAPPPEAIIDAARQHLAHADAEHLVSRLVPAVAEQLLDPTVPTRSIYELVDEAAPHPIEQSVIDSLLWQLFVEREEPQAIVGASALLGALRRHGVSIRLLSNCVLPGPLMLRMLAQVGIDGPFDGSVFSSDGLHRKPHTDAFLATGTGFQRVVMIGDSETDDLAPARALGWPAMRAGPDRLPPVDAVLGALDAADPEGRIWC